MIFTSIEFIVFFLAVLLLRACCRTFGAEKWVLLVASYIFYGSWSLPCLGLLFAVSAVDYALGRAMGNTSASSTRRALLMASLVLNLGLLGFFKYTNFLLASGYSLLGLFGLPAAPPHWEILLPVGISFFTFQSMSYTIDVYRKELQPCTSFRDFLLFVSFFPQLVAGPIVRAADFLPQLFTRRRATVREVESGLALFGLGAIKKAVISDQISGHVDAVFAAPGTFDAPTLILAAVGYAIQIYCDFSGYTDMAIGAARIMGYEFLANFRMPYSALSIAEFWRRWHISLSTWLRDYLYIPLGGNRGSSAQTYRNLLITMLLGGLWHGAGWNFLIWGALHGIALAIQRAWSRTFPRRLPAPVGWVLTMAVVLIGWIFFRAQGGAAAWTYISKVVTWSGGVRSLSPQIFAAIASLAIAHLLSRKDGNWSLEIIEKSALVRTLVYAGMIFLLATLASSDSTPFIYFQF